MHRKYSFNISHISLPLVPNWWKPRKFTWGIPANWVIERSQAVAPCWFVWDSSVPRTLVLETGWGYCPSSWGTQCKCWPQSHHVCQNAVSFPICQQKAWGFVDKKKIIIWGSSGWYRDSRNVKGIKKEKIWTTLIFFYKFRNGQRDPWKLWTWPSGLIRLKGC